MLPAPIERFIDALIALGFPQSASKATNAALCHAMNTFQGPALTQEQVVTEFATQVAFYLDEALSRGMGGQDSRPFHLLADDVLFRPLKATAWAVANLLIDCAPRWDTLAPRIRAAAPRVS